MKQVLIVNLRRLGDVYSTAHLIDSMKANSDVEISMLVFKESKKAAQNISGVKEIFTIDREELLTINSNKLFADTMALDRLYSSIKPIKDLHWNQVINFSNDLVGAYLCSYFSSSADNVIGIRFNENRNIVTNTTWEILFNDVLPTVKYSPVHFVDCYHNMLGLNYANTNNKLKTKPEHDSEAARNMAEIKSTLSDSSSSKIVAIQLTTASKSKNLTTETIVKYINFLKTSADIIPLILIAPNEEERKLADLVNNFFNQELIVVEADLTALVSVLRNIDLLVTPDTAIKHIADLCHTPVLEISLGEAPFLKQGTYQQDSLILTDVISNRNFKASSSEVNTQIKAEDIYVATIYHFSNTKVIKPRLSENVTLYRVSRDNLGAAYIPVAGTIDSNSEIERLMSKQFINSLMNGTASQEIYSEIAKLGFDKASEWCQGEKSIITNVMKDLLGTLRSLLQCIENKRSSKDFVNNLSKLISHCEENSVTQISTIIFKTKIEGINARSFEENAKEVETLLYELKSNIQKNLNNIKELEEKIYLQRKEELFQRTNQTIG